MAKIKDKTDNREMPEKMTNNTSGGGRRSEGIS